MSVPGSPQSSVIGVIYTSQIGRIYPSQAQTSASRSTAASQDTGGIATSEAPSSSATNLAPLTSTSTSSSSSSRRPTTSSDAATSTGAAGIGGGIANSASSSGSTTSAPTSSTTQSSVTSAAATSSQTAGGGSAGLNSAASSNGSNHYRNHVVIPAAVVCSVVGALLIALLLWFCVFRKRRRNRASKNPDASAAALNRYSPDIDDEKNYTLPQVDAGTPGLGHGMPFTGAAPVAATAAPFMAAGYHKERGPGTSNSIPFAALGPLAGTAVPYMTAGLHKEAGHPAAAASPTRPNTTESPGDPPNAPWVAQPLRHFKRQSLRGSATASPGGEVNPGSLPTGYRDHANMPGADQRSYAPVSPPSYSGGNPASSGLGAAALGSAAVGGAAIASPANRGSPSTHGGAPFTAPSTGPLPAVPSSQQQYRPYRQPDQDRGSAHSGVPPAAVGAVRARELSNPDRPDLNRSLSALEEASVEDSVSLYSEGRREGRMSGFSSVFGSQRIPHEHGAYGQGSYHQAPAYEQSSQTQPGSSVQPGTLNFAGGTFYSDRDSLQPQSLDPEPAHGGTFLESPRDSGLPQSSRATDNESETSRPGLGAREEYYTAPTGLGFGSRQTEPETEPQPRDRSQNSERTRNTSSGLWSGLTDSSDSTNAEPTEPPLYRSGTVTSGTGRIHGPWSGTVYDGPWSGTIARGGPSGAAAVTGAVPGTTDSAPKSEAGSEDWASGSPEDSPRRQSEGMMPEVGVAYRRDSVREIVMGRGDEGRGRYAAPGAGDDGVGIAR